MGRWQNMTSQIGIGVWCGVVLWCGVVVWFGLVWSGVVLPPPSSFGWGLPSSFGWWCSPLSSIGVVCSLLHREKPYLLRLLGSRKINFIKSKTLVGWLVGVATDRHARNAGSRFFSFFLFVSFASTKNSEKKHFKKHQKKLKNRKKRGLQGVPHRDGSKKSQ